MREAQSRAKLSQQADRIGHIVLLNLGQDFPPCIEILCELDLPATALIMPSREYFVEEVS